jgi:hypothetical protein
MVTVSRAQIRRESTCRVSRLIPAAAPHAPAGTFNVADDEPLTKREYAAALASVAGHG